MGNKRTKQLIVLIVLFLFTGLFVYIQKQPAATVRKPALQSRLAVVNGYRIVRHIEIEEDIYKFLDLDDYIFADYLGQDGKVNLFIGFYYTADKVSAAHSPLACFPGQGWTINQPAKRRVNVGDVDIQYAEITATLGEQKELVIYWYQAGKKTTPQVYKNKINTLYNKVMIDDEQHAFVRITIPLVDSSYDEAEKVALDFIQAFYPNFLEFIDVRVTQST